MDPIAQAFPTEIQHRIINFTVVDVPEDFHGYYKGPSRPSAVTLLCGLVCKDWNRQSRLLSFREISLKSDSWSMRFLALCHHRLSTFKNCVQELTLNFLMEDDMDLLLSDRISLLPFFPLTSLRLFDAPFGQHEVTKFIAPRLFPTTLTNLLIDFCTFPSPLAFSKGIESCINLQHLTLNRIQDPLVEDLSWVRELKANPEFNSPRHLRTLKLELLNETCRSVELFLVQLSSTPREQLALDTFALVIRRGTPMLKQLETFFQRIGPRLTEFSITGNCDLWLDESTNWPARIPSWCQNLHGLRKISFQAGYRKISEDQIILRIGNSPPDDDMILQVLRNLPSPTSLEIVRLNVQIMSGREESIVDDNGSPSLDMVNGTHFRNLKKVEFDYRPIYDLEWTKQLHSKIKGNIREDIDKEIVLS
ncbi:hypothetical protein DL96DRAFT_1823798 [Flagelloscypha sp. PMI_526]|nr:hypothetical protein DL96DRAFT_1823798 [Flagelloscypha sp. PMI_526]